MNKRKITPSQNVVSTVHAPKWYLSRFWPYVLFASLVIVLYAATLNFEFSPMDDHWLVLARKSVLSDFSNFPSLFSESTLNIYYRPLLNVTFMIDTILGNGSPFFFHLTNVLLHLCCCFALFRFLLLLEIDKALAFFAVLLFTVHPVNVQAVSWIPGRNDTLLTLFILLSCIFLIRFLREKDANWILLHFLFFAGCLATKENAVVLPLIYAMLTHFIAAENKTRKALMVFAAGCVVCIGYVLLQQSIVSTTPAIATINADSFAEFAFALLVHSGKILLPVQQSINPLSADTSIIPYLIALFILSSLIWKFGVRNKHLAVMGLVWFLVLIILPAWHGATNGIGEQYEHRVYAPLIGMILLLSQVKIPASPKIVRTGLLVIILIFGIKTIHRQSVYATEFSYATAGTVEAPGIPWYHDMVGFMLHEKHDYKNALVYYNRAIALDTTEGEYFNHRGNTYSVLRQHRDAWHDYNKVLSIDSLQKETYISRSIANYGLKDYLAAVRDLERGIALGAHPDPAFVEALKVALRRMVPDTAETRRLPLQ